MRKRRSPLKGLTPAGPMPVWARPAPEGLVSFIPKNMASDTATTKAAITLKSAE